MQQELKRYLTAWGEVDDDLDGIAANLSDSDRDLIDKLITDIVRLVGTAERLAEAKEQ